MTQARGNVYLGGSIQRVAVVTQEFSAACYYLIVLVLANFHASKAVSTHASTRTSSTALVSSEFLLGLAKYFLHMLHIDISKKQSPIISTKVNTPVILHRQLV